MYFLLSYLYRFIVAIRFWLYNHNILKKYTFSVPIISIGNIAVGGSGKTPMTIYLAKLLTKKNIRHVIVSRGYKKQVLGTIIVSDGRGNIVKSYKESGDEPLLIAQTLPKTPIVVGEKKQTAIHKAIQVFKPQVVLLDDALQSYYVHKDVDIALFNCLHTKKQFYFLPYGLLRERVSALLRTKLVVFTKHNLATEEHADNLQFYKVINFLNKNKHPFIMANCNSFYQEYSINKKSLLLAQHTELNSLPVIAFSGVGDSVSFNLLCNKYFTHIRQIIDFPDHHHYKKLKVFLKNHLKNIQNIPKGLVITHKDLIKLQDEDNSILQWIHNKKMRVFVIQIETSISNQQAIEKIIKNLGL
tara:strand:- start:839 stop:1909 length:1071 start_codon:yes stop_codon:yes gene_type:complete